MNVTVRQLAEWVQGQIDGDADLVITKARPLYEAQAGHVTLLDNDKQLAKLEACPASAAVVSASLAAVPGKTLIRVADPMGAFIIIAEKLHARPALEHTGIDARAIVDPSAVIGPDPSVAPFASIGAGSRVGARCRIASGASVGRECVLGDDVVLHPNVVLYDGTIVGDRTIIHANSVLGADGFGYRFQKGRHVKVPQLGYVEIGADVEIGACTTIDRGAFGSTKIGDGTKIDNLVMIGHNCKIGKHNILAAQVGIAGSCTTGSYVMMGGQVGVKDHIDVGAGAMMGAEIQYYQDPKGFDLAATIDAFIKQYVGWLSAPASNGRALARRQRRK